jgi:hypothetical protein
VGAHDVVRLDSAGRQRERSVQAAVFHRHDLTGVQAIQHDRRAEQAAAE